MSLFLIDYILLFVVFQVFDFIGMPLLDLVVEALAVFQLESQIIDQLVCALFVRFSLLPSFLQQILVSLGLISRSLGFNRLALNDL